jgi:hypothetical protein
LIPAQVKAFIPYNIQDSFTTVLAALAVLGIGRVPSLRSGYEKARDMKSSNVENL